MNFLGGGREKKLIAAGPATVPLSPSAIKNLLDGALDLSKGVVGAGIKDAVGEQLSKQLIGIIATEGAKALSGVVGRVIIAMVLKSLDTTTKRLTELERRLDKHEQLPLILARDKLAAIDHYAEMTDHDGRAFRNQLVNEARVALELYYRTLEQDSPEAQDILLTLIVCASQVPGGKNYAALLAAPLFAEWRKKSEELAGEAKAFKKQAREYEVGFWTGGSPGRPAKLIYVPRLGESIEASPEIPPSAPYFVRDSKEANELYSKATEFEDRARSYDVVSEVVSEMVRS